MNFINYIKSKFESNKKESQININSSNSKFPKGSSTSLNSKKSSKESMGSKSCSDEIDDNLPEIKNMLDDYKIVKIVHNNEHKKKYVINKLSNKNEKDYFLKLLSYKNKEECDSQIKIHNTLKLNLNIYLIDVHHFSNYGNVCCFIYEYYHGQNLLEFVETTKISNNIIIILKILEQILLGIKYLYDNHIIHCDIKLENIIINKNHNIKIIDFDLAKIGNHENEYVSNVIFGTKNYISPENYDLGIYSTKSDIWASGIILYIFIMGVFPYDCELSFMNSYSNLYRRNEFRHIDLDKVKEKSKSGLFYYDLLMEMLEFDVTKRMNINKLLCFFNKKKIELYT
jgi:serine/threonine protein kinase